MNQDHDKNSLTANASSFSFYFLREAHGLFYPFSHILILSTVSYNYDFVCEDSLVYSK